MNKAVQPIRVGFLGTGYIADWHAKALSMISAVSLDAVCDKDKPRAQAFGQRYGVSQCYESLDAMLEDADLDLDVGSYPPSSRSPRPRGVYIDRARGTRLRRKAHGDYRK